MGTVFLGQEFDALQELNLDTNLLVEVSGELRGYSEGGGRSSPAHTLCLVEVSGALKREGGGRGRRGCSTHLR